MRRRTFPILVMLIGVVVLPAIGDACSTFCLLRQDQPLFGRNYDWMVGDAVVMVNKRGVVKTAMGSQSARWTSRYGSVTFNQYGREVPMGGMNEAGLVVATLSLKDTQYAEPDHRPTINTLQWMQYQLDTASTVKGVLASDANLRVRPSGTAKVHYFVCDRTGICASIEFLEGKQVAHIQDTMSVKALTNHTYAQSVAFLQQHEGFGGTQPLPASHRSLDRFARAASLVSQYDPQTHRSAIDYAFEVLANVAQKPHTKSPTLWSLVYDIHQRRIHFRTLRNPNRRYIDLDDFDYSCTMPVQVLDINREGRGNMTPQFSTYDQKGNRDQIGNAIRKTPFLADTPSHVIDALAEYPFTTICTEVTGKTSSVSERRKARP